MRTRGVVFQGQRLSSPYGAAAPASDLPDVSRYKTDGTFVNNTAWTQLPSGLWIMEFDGTADYVEATAIQCDFVSGDFTLAAWVALAAVGQDGCIFSRGEFNVGGYYFHVNSSNGITLLTNQAAAAQNVSSTGTLLALNIYSHCVVARTSTVARIYIDGVDVTSGAGTVANPVASARTLRIGCSWTTAWGDLEGYIGLPAIYNYRLSQDEINKIYQSERYLFGV